MNVGVRFLAGVFLCGSLAAVTATQAMAEETTEERRPKVEVSAGTWFLGQGSLTWAHNASSVAGLGNPTSKLTYKDVGTTVGEVTGKFWVTPKVFGRVNFGYGNIGGGRLTDDDYGTSQLFSRTYSNLPGDNMYYLNADVGARVKEFANHRGWFDVFGGYQYWHTKYTATGVTQVVCNPNAIPGFTCSAPGSVSNQGQTVITNTADWHSLRVGASVEYLLRRWLAVRATAAVIPLSLLDNKDVHHLRGDLQQNPSFSMTGLGIGADADVGLRFFFARHVAMDVGYRIYYNRVVDGDLKTHPVSGASQTFPLTQFESLRHGLTTGLSILF